MLRLVPYDPSSDEADYSGNDQEDVELKKEPLDDETVISSLLNQLLDITCDDGVFARPILTDQIGSVDMRWRPSTPRKDSNSNVKSRIRRKRRHVEIGDKSSTDNWSDLDSCSDNSSSSSDDGINRQRTTTSFPIKREPDHEFSEDSDYVYAKIVLESRRIRESRNGSTSLKPPKTKGEIDVDDLPPLEDLHVSIPINANLRRIGLATSIVDKLAIVQSDYGIPPLDEGSWLVNQCREPIGQVFEIFGPVPRPFYSVRFNTPDDAKRLLTVGHVVYFFPDNDQFTRTVFADNLRLMKGSDASWEDNNEPPEDAREFSDDEEERRWKAQNRRSGCRMIYRRVIPNEQSF